MKAGEGVAPQCLHLDFVAIRLRFGALLEVCKDCGRSRFHVEGVAGTSWKSPGMYEGAPPWESKPPPSKIPLFKVRMAGDADFHVADVLKSGYIGQGPKVAEFEEKLRGLTGLDHVYATNSCTSAIELALDVIGIGPGDKVISTPMTCLATNAPLVRRGAQIIWADVNSYTGIIDPDSVKKILKAHRDVKAIMAVDYAGRLAPILDLKLAGPIRYGIARPPIIEDAAHVLSTHLAGGDFICLSFQAIKFLTCGDGGALLTQHPCDKAKLLRWYGLDRSLSESFRCVQKPSLPGGKLHMNDIAAVIGLANWNHAIDGVQRARERALYYSDAIKEVERVFHVPKAVESPWLYPILVDDRDAFVQYMHRHAVEVSPVHCRNDDAPVHKNAISLGPLPGVSYFDNHQACLPVGPWVTGYDARRIELLVNAQAW